MLSRRWLVICIVCIIYAVSISTVHGENDDTVDENIAKSRGGSRTDDEVVEREEEAIKLDGLSVKQYKELRDKAEKHEFQAEVSRMMKLIINSLYKNKEIFLRELISNASDALDKIRLMSLTQPEALKATADLSIRIKADKENHILTITDTGIGMTKKDLSNNLGTIAKSGTNEFMQKLVESDAKQQSDLIGQFGVGFYSAFLVADKVVVTSKHNDDKQYIWESDAASFSIVADPRGPTLQRGSSISLHLKEEAYDYLEMNTIKDLIKKYSQFINFDIFVWSSKSETVEEPIEEDEAPKEEKKSDDDDAAVEEEKEEKPKTKKVEKTVWDWEKMNENKPLWMRKSEDITQDEYNAFYKAFSKDSEAPVAQVHFKAEGEVTFNALLYIPKKLPADMFNNYGKKTDHIKLYVRRVFITDDFQAMMPKYLSFVRGIVDSDDLPLNVSRETLQQHKLLKVIQKKLVRKVLDMIKKMDKEQYDTFWKEFSTNMKLGVMEDTSNRTRVSKLLRFFTSSSPDVQVSLGDYVERMKEKQEHIYYMCGSGKAEVQSSPFVERLIKKGYEVVFCVEPVDEYAIQAMPEFDGKKFQNVAKDGVQIDQGEKAKERQKALEDEFKPLTDWLKEKALKEDIEKASVSQRLTTSPCALVASTYGWSGNMERIMKSQAYAKPNDPTQNFYATQKKTFEINPRHPVVKELLKRVAADADDTIASSTAKLLFETATLRSGYALNDQVGFADRIEKVLKTSMNIDLDAAVEDEEEINEDEASPAAESPEESEDGAKDEL